MNDPTQGLRATQATQTTQEPQAEAIRQAVLALQNSRAALRGEMLPAPDEGAGKGPASGDSLHRWWRRLRRLPAGRWLRQAAGDWWQAHPWRPLGDTLAGEARHQVLPLVRRHPWAAVGVAAAAGAAVVALRPWRWHWLDARVRQAPSAASRWLLRQATSAPVQTALASLVLWASQRPPASSAPIAPSAPSAPSAPPRSTTAPMPREMPQEMPHAV